jgi:protein-tyrosine-phosphatase/DNA-binding transcriptional ArsR family regulator
MVTSPVPVVNSVRLFKALADETRLAIVRLLTLTDLRGGEIVARLGLPQNAVSYHLRQLREVGILRDRRSHADARDIYYTLDLPRLEVLYQQAGADLHPLLGQTEPTAPTTDISAEVERPLRVLFLCTHNSARSQLAEAILRRRGGDAVDVASAGNEPTALHPQAIMLLEEHSIDTSRHRAKSLDQFTGQSFDYVVTVCDRANEQCPVFPDDPLHIHWSFPDPTTVEDVTAQRHAFSMIWQDLQLRVDVLLNLPHPTTGRRLRSATAVSASAS